VDADDKERSTSWSAYPRHGSDIPESASARVHGMDWGCGGVFHSSLIPGAARSKSRGSPVADNLGTLLRKCRQRACKDSPNPRSAMLWFTGALSVLPDV
jgi:hypothetical protein